MRLVLLLFIALCTLQVGAKSLEKELKELDTDDAVPSTRLQDRLYSVQMRAHPLTAKREILASYGQVFSGSEFLHSSQLAVEGQYHFDDRWAVAGGVARVANTFSSSANNLLNTAGYLPDVDYARWRLEARAQMNLLYGKIRFTRMQAVSFDQYLGLGVAYNDLRSGSSLGPVGDIGLAFWLGEHASVHLGVKDYYYAENRTLTKGYTHNAQAYAQAGYIF
jgi:outer membrane beta-barrel protein